MNKVTIKFDKKVDKKLTDDPSISQRLSNLLCK